MQVHSLLRHWKRQSDCLLSICRVCRRQLQQDHVQQPATQLKQRDRIRTQSSWRRCTFACNSVASGDSNIVAGIPVSAANTTAGHSLWQTLQHQQLQFVSSVKACLKELAAEGLPLQSQHAQEEGILVSTRRKALLEDVLYYWAVAEAYLADASLQASFR